MTLQPGQLLDQYRLIEEIGAGGMGVVWRARDTTLDRDVAIKVLPAAFTENAERAARFEREAKAVAALSHPNIVSIYGFGQADGTTYAAIELLEGTTLREQLEGGPLAPRTAVGIARQIAAGLDAAHSKGIAHRDLKPENVFVAPDGRARILDFGLAAPTGGSGDVLSQLPTAPGLTGPGAILGTVGYMSPEQVRGSRADSRSDIFALGVVLYEMLSGQRPFVGETAAETMTAILRSDAPALTIADRPVPAALARVVARCLEKGPDERFQSARDLAFALDGALVDSGTAALPAPALTARSPRLRGLAVAGLAILAFGAGWLLRPAPSAPDPPRISQLTFSGADLQPDASPDGRLVAFTSTRAGVSQIWLRQLDGGEQALTEGPDSGPRFSPDGGQVAFVRNEGEIYSAYRIPVVGGQPRKLLEDVSEVEWSPDGRQLAFLRAVAGSVATVVLGVYDLDSRGETTLYQVEAWYPRGLAWSPDGRRIAAVEANPSGSGLSRLVLVPTNDANPEWLTSREGVTFSPPQWVGSEALVYATWDTPVTGSAEPARIVRLDLPSGRERTLLWESNLFPLRGTFSESARLAVLGRDALVFDSTQQMQLIWEQDLAGGSPRQLQRGVSHDRQPVYSPDGSRVLFTSSRSGNTDLFAHELASGRLLQITDHPGGDWDGAFSPDGRSILWSSDRGGNLEIWMADADGSNPRQVSHDGIDAENPTMTRDGEWIVYVSGHTERPGLYKVRPDGSDTTLLLAGVFGTPDVSPDGRHAQYVLTDRTQTVNEIRVVDVGSGEIADFSIQIPYGPEAPNVSYGRGRWLPGGSAIAYVGLDDAGRVGVWVQDFVPGRDTSDTRRPLVPFSEEALIESFGISPDGTRVAMSFLRETRVLRRAEGLPLR